MARYKLMTGKHHRHVDGGLVTFRPGAILDDLTPAELSIAGRWQEVPDQTTSAPAEAKPAASETKTPAETQKEPEKKSTKPEDGLRPEDLRVQVVASDEAAGLVRATPATEVGLEQLKRFLTAELQHPKFKGGRKSVLGVIEAQIALTEEALKAEE